MKQEPIQCCSTEQVRELQNAFIASLFAMAKEVPLQIEVDDAVRQQIYAAVAHGIVKAAREAAEQFLEMYQFTAVRTVN